jgi:ribosomal protein S18 acetylase RimI-like enzyme
MKITQLDDVNQESVRKELIAYLEPHESKALFLLGNLQSHFQPAFLYVAKEKNRLIGVCGYYPTFQSCTIFSESSAASKAFAQTVLKNHPSVIALTGMANMVQPAYDEFTSYGRKPTNIPRQDFFELTMKNFRPFFLSDVTIRPIAERDVDSAARLHRLIHHASMDDPITEEERKRIRFSPVSFCLEMEERVVSVASSNGLAIHAFQILGVATDPSYQRRGYAKALCSYLIQFMQKSGAEKAIIFTGEENTAARKCYLDLGFQITDKYYVGLFEPAQ